MTMLADDFLHMRLGPVAESVARSVTSAESLIRKAHEQGHIRFEPAQQTVLLHGHCQQKAIFGMQAVMEALKLVPGLKVQELDSGCCGMAGSFGYDKSHFELSHALAERVLLKALKDQPHAILLASGTSCRAQVADFSSAKALHPLQFLADRIRTGE